MTPTTVELPSHRNINDDDGAPVEPNWKALELMMDQAINWIVGCDAADEYGPAELEMMALAHELFFQEFDSREAKLKRIAYRVTCMAQAEEDLEELLYPFRDLRELSS